MRGDTYRYGNLFSSSPAVGFWAVIAVSGSVALLTFGKKRLWSHHHHHVSTTPCSCNHSSSSSSSNGSSGDDDVGTGTILALDCGEVQEKTLESSSEQNAQQVDDAKRIPKQVVNDGVFVDGDDDDKKIPKKALQSSLVTPSSGKKTRPVVLKKVRFAPDVVEPSGDGHEYRCRNQAIHNDHSNKVYNKKQEHEGLYHSNGLSSHRSKSLGSKTRTTTKPCLPENRMMLYGGMHRYKTLLALHWG